MGALTFKQYSYKARAWELKSRMAIDVLDSMLCSIRLDYIGTDLMRIVPNYSAEEGRKSWITDKIRYGYDGLKRQRLLKPLSIKGGRVVRLSWGSIIPRVLDLVDKNKKDISIYVGNLLALESIYCSKSLLNFLGVKFWNKGNNLSLRGEFSLPKTFNTFEACVLLGTNLRKELPLLYYSLRKAVSIFNVKVLCFGTNAKYYEKDSIYYVGNSCRMFYTCLLGYTVESIYLARSKRSLFIIGNNVLKDKEGYNWMSLVEDVYHKVNINAVFVRLSLFSSQMCLNELGVCTNYLGSRSSKLAYVLGADNLEKVSKDVEIIYQGHHIGSLLRNVSLILPSKVFLETNGSYLNIFGERKGTQDLVGPTNIFMDWEVVSLFSAILVNFKKLTTTFSGVTRNLKRDLIIDDIVIDKLLVKERFCGVWVLGEYWMCYDYINSFYELDLLSKSSKLLLNKRKKEN